MGRDVTIHFAHLPETIAAVRADYADNLSLAEIQSTHGVTRQTIRRWCNPTNRPRPAQRLLSTAPLLRFLADRQLTVRSIDRTFGLSVARSIRHGGLSWIVADHVAVAVGVLPYDIWDEEWFEAALGDGWDSSNEWDVA